MPPAGLRGRWHGLAGRLTRLVPHDALALVNRVAIAAILFMSGRTKVEGWLTVTDSAYSLFRDEYRLPLVPVDIAARAAVCAGHLFPLLLVLGLFTRLSALTLLGMTLVIQIFVYPDAWPTHLSWAAAQGRCRWTACFGSPRAAGSAPLALAGPVRRGQRAPPCKLREPPHNGWAPHCL